MREQVKKLWKLCFNDSDEFISGSMLVKLFTKEKVEYEKFRKINNETTKITIREQRAGSWFHVFLGMFIQIAPLLIYFAGGFLIISNTDKGLTVGDISVVVRPVNRIEQRIGEAEKLGFKQILIPKHNLQGMDTSKLKIEIIQIGRASCRERV